MFGAVVTGCIDLLDLLIRKAPYRSWHGAEWVKGMSLSMALLSESNTGCPQHPENRGVYERRKLAGFIVLPVFIQV